MNITLDYRNPTRSHCDVAIFIDGALTGVLTLRRRSKNLAPVRAIDKKTHVPVIQIQEIASNEPA
jgi:hypothetical protein